jgi:cell division protein FtsQ
MWDNPRLLNFAANLLFAAAAFICLCIAVLATLNSSMFPLRKLVVEGEVRNVDVQAVAEAIAGRVTGNFFGVDLEGVRNALEEIPAVRQAFVQRRWPDRLHARLEEHAPLARWEALGGKSADAYLLVNREGELFRGVATDPLPQFSGPAGSEARVTARYAEFSDAVAPLGAAVTSISVSSRSAWQIRLAMKDRPLLTLMLGRAEDDHAVAQRLQRFVRLYPQMQGQLPRGVQYIDLRYAQGFAVRMPASNNKGPNT